MPRPRTPHAPRPLAVRPSAAAGIARPARDGDRVAATYDLLRVGHVARMLDGGAEVRWSDGLTGWAPLSMLVVLP